MVKAGRYEFELLGVDRCDLGERRVGAFGRRSKGRRYVSPRVLFSSRDGGLIGRGFVSFRGRASLRRSLYVESLGFEVVDPKRARVSYEGDFVLLFFPDELDGFRKWVRGPTRREDGVRLKELMTRARFRFRDSV